MRIWRIIMQNGGSGCEGRAAWGENCLWPICHVSRFYVMIKMSRDTSKEKGNSR